MGGTDAPGRGRPLGNKNGVDHEVLACLRAAGRPLTITEVAARVGRSSGAVRANVRVLGTDGRVVRGARVLRHARYTWAYVVAGDERGGTDGRH